MAKTKSPATVYLSPCDEPFEFAHKSVQIGGERRKVYRKELIYPGHFVKIKPGENEPEIEFDVSEDLIDHWVKTTNRMIKNGIDIPLPLEHTTSPEARRGSVIKLAKEFNASRGMASLYAYATFRDEDAEKLASTTQVSLYSPPSYTDGRGRRYDRPIRHVALTDYPVIPGLDGFEVIAASHVDRADDAIALCGEDSMKITALAKKLGIAIADGADDFDAANAILSGYQKRGRRLAAYKKKLAVRDEDEEEQNMLSSKSRRRRRTAKLSNGLDARQLRRLALMLAEEDDEEDVEDEDDESSDDEERMLSARIKKLSARLSALRKKKLSVDEDDEDDEEKPEVAASLVKAAMKVRKHELKGLVMSGAITPGVREKLEKVYATPETVTLALSSHHDDSDGFDRLVSILKDNKGRLELGEQTGIQVPGGSEGNALIRDAERRNGKK